VVSRPEHPTNVLTKYTGNRLLAALPEQAIAQLALDLRQVTLPQGVVCYGAGDPIDQVYRSHCHPGGLSWRGATNLGVEVDSKLLELLHDAVPSATRPICTLRSSLCSSTRPISIPKPFLDVCNQLPAPSACNFMS